MTIQVSQYTDVALRVLLVEDDPDVVEDIQQILESKLRRSRVVTAMSVNEANSVIRRAGIEKAPFHLGLLDFRLPPSKGMQDEVDTSVCSQLRGLKVPIIHFSAWTDDPVIKKHMQEIHPKDTLVDARVVLVKKTATAEWIERIVELINPYYESIVSNRVSVSLRRVLGDAVGGEDVSGSAVPRIAMEPVGSGTYAMINLRKDIVDFWTFLSKDVKTQVRNAFEVVDLDGPLKKLSLFRPQVKEDVKAS